MSATRRVGDILWLERRTVEIDPLTEYTLIGVYSFGKGIFHREPIPGAQLGNYRFFEVKAGDLVLSNIQAWEGAIAHAAAVDEGCIGTHRFLTYLPVHRSQVDTNYLRYYFLSEPGFALIQRASPGSVTRNRTLSIDRFEALEIPLPRIDEQRRIAAHLDSVLNASSDLVVRRRRSEPIWDGLLAGSVANLVEEASVGSHVLTLGDVAEWGSGGTPSANMPIYYGGEIPWAVIGDLNDGVVTTTQSTLTAEGISSSSARLIEPGAVLIAMYGSIGKLGIAGLPMTTNQAIAHAVPHEVSPEYLFWYLRSQRQAMLSAGKGGAQRNISQAMLKGWSIPVPTARKQEFFVTAMRELFERDTLVRGLLSKSHALVSALIPSALNHAFIRSG